MSFDKENINEQHRAIRERINKRNRRKNLIIIILVAVISYSLGSLGLFGANGNNAYENKIRDVENIINKEYLRDVTEEQMLEGQVKGIVSSLNDPYSAYYNKEEYKALMEDTSGSFGGIGVVVTPGKDGFITVVSPIANTPGDKAGLRSGDRIIKVDGEEYRAEDMEEAVNNMKGEPETEVKITILRGEISNVEELDINIVREMITIETIESDMLERNIGYISISTFNEDTSIDFKEQLDELENKDMKSLILDLRGNPGGLLNEVVDIADIFIDDGDIVYTEDKSAKKSFIKAKKGGKDYPIVVLINNGSASASEILAGALKDHNLAKIVGETSFGKGVVQSLTEFRDGTGIKLTVSEYFTPNGVKIDGVGVEPDLEIKLDEDIEGIGLEFLEADNQLQKAIELLK